MLAGAEDGEIAIVPVDRRATAAGLTLVARHRGIAEVDATRALQEIARSGGAIPQLRGGPLQNRLGKHGIVPQHGGMLGQHRVPHCGADLQAAIGQALDLIEGEPVNIDDLVRAFDIQLHQIHQRGAARQKADAGSLLGGG